jgi:hypothetical protein
MNSYVYKGTACTQLDAPADTAALLALMIDVAQALEKPL